MQHKPLPRSLRSRWLGRQLRDIRERRGMTLKMVGEVLQRDHTALSRYERAEWPIRRAEVVALLDLYGCHDEETRRRFLQLVDDVWTDDPWIRDYGDVVDPSFVDFPWLESRAEVIHSYHATLIPGLFQLPEYAALVIRNAEGPHCAQSAVDRWVELRMNRQRLLDDERGARIEAVIDEAALRRRVGGAALMRAQLDRIGQLAGKGRVEVRVLPADVALHDGLGGSFWFFQLPSAYPAGVGYLEYLTGRAYVESAESEHFLRAYRRVRDAALDPRDSAKLIATISEEL
ncbi:MAG TPA: helix-turn-helix transcriptional regulator [Micromonospora sp.]